MLLSPILFCLMIWTSCIHYFCVPAESAIWSITVVNSLSYYLCRTCHMYLFHQSKLLVVLVVLQDRLLLAQWPAMRVASWNSRFRISRYLIFHLVCVSWCYSIYLSAVQYMYLTRLFKFYDLQDSIEKLLIWFTEDLSVWWASATHFSEAWTGDGVLFTRFCAFQTMFEDC